MDGSNVHFGYDIGDIRFNDRSGMIQPLNNNNNYAIQLTVSVPLRITEK